MDHCLRIIKFYFVAIFFFNLQTSADPLRPDQRPRDKKNETIEAKNNSEEIIKWPRATVYVLGLDFSNSRIDGFQMKNNTKGTLVSETNMAVSIQYFNWIKREYDFSVGLNFESIKMYEVQNLIPIDNSQVLALGVNVMGRYLVYDNLYLKVLLGQQDKIFYAPNAGLTGYEIQKPMIPFVGLGCSVLFFEFKKIKLGFEVAAQWYQSSAAGTYQIDSGQGYEIKIFSIWPRGTEQIVSEFFYNARTQNTTLIRTEEQKIGFGLKYQF